MIAAAFFVTMLGPTIPTPLYPIYEENLGFGGLMVTTIFATYAVGVAIALMLFGRLSDQVGRRALLLPGLALALLSSAVFLIPDSIAALFLGRILSGLSVGIFTGTATAALTDLAPPGAQRRYSLIAALVNMLGLGLGPVMAGALAEFTAAPLTLPYLSHIGLVLVAIIGIVMIAEPLDRVAQPFKWEFQRLGLPAQVRGTFIAAATAGIAGFSVLGLFASVAPALLIQVLGVTNHLVCGLIVFAQLGFSAIGQVASTKMRDRSAMLIGTAALSTGVLLTGMSIVASSLPILLAGAAIAGLGQGMSFRASLAALAEQSPVASRGEITSTFFLVLYVAQALPVMGVGLAAAPLGLAVAGVGFAVFVALIAASAFLSLLVMGKVRHKNSPE
ncbi:putative MFS family arabinose efflux permease [Ochrobactrum daejeonense]|uniref:Putative MFS family arabinose efflux permease n=1 Tax=Brucella daejeonensis TaxID=659015 RepID=A0A7W9EPX9_9HYPH|nr:MFS transporter [Brucella daejeonensis]MBB5704640.1 putative MFS family arabinose efflux permease [Brucella daejeonensis]